MRTLRSVEPLPTLLAGVDIVPVPPLTADILPEDAMFDKLRGGNV